MVFSSSFAVQFLPLSAPRCSGHAVGCAASWSMKSDSTGNRHTPDIHRPDICDVQPPPAAVSHTALTAGTCNRPASLPGRPSSSIFCCYNQTCFMSFVPRPAPSPAEGLMCPSVPGRHRIAVLRYSYPVRFATSFHWKSKYRALVARAGLSPARIFTNSRELSRLYFRHRAI